MNLLRAVFHPSGLRRLIVNWHDVSRHLMARAERELGHAAPDERGAALLEELRSYGGVAPHSSSDGMRPADLLLPVHIRKEGLELRMFSTIMTLGTP